MRAPAILTAAVLCAAPLTFLATSATAETKAAACSVQAHTKKLTGERREAFLKTCKEGALATVKPTLAADAGRSDRAITAPSGADRNKRSAQCSAESVRRHLPEIKAKEFRLSCLATAGPVQEAQDQTQAPKPAPAKPGLGQLPRPHDN
jgi:hypothetical protein